MKKIFETNLKAILMYVLTAIIIINSGSMYKYLTNTSVYIRGIWIIYAMVCFIYILLSKRIRITYQIANRLPIILIIMLVYITISRVNVQSYLKNFLLVFVCFFLFSTLLYQNGKMEVFLKRFSNVIVFIAVISMFFWFFGSIMHILPGRSKYTYVWNDSSQITYSYYYLYFENTLQIISHSAICNVAIFTESPAYSAFLTYAILIEIIQLDNTDSDKYARKKKKILFRIAILVSATFTTYSTKGIIAIIIAIAIKYVLKDTDSKNQKIIKIIISIFVIGMVAIVGSSLVENKLATDSGTGRISDLQAGIDTFKQHPIFGVGYLNEDSIIQNRSGTSIRGLSMGITTLLAEGGICLFVLYLGAIVVTYRNAATKNNRKEWFLITIVLVYNLFVSNSAFSDTYLFIIAAAYAMPKFKKNKLSFIRSYNYAA